MENISPKSPSVNKRQPHLTKLRAYIRRRYHRRKDSGLCTFCGKVPARPGRVSCEACARAHVVRETRRQNRLEVIQRELGICRYCDSREAIPGHRVCGYCQELRAEASARFRARRIAAGLCIDCGAPVYQEKRRCATCLEANAKHQREYRAIRSLRLGGAA